MTDSPNVCSGREVDDALDEVLPDGGAQALGVQYVTIHEIASADQFPVSRGQVVVSDDAVASVGQGFAGMASNVACSACDQDAHALSLPQLA